MTSFNPFTGVAERLIGQSPQPTGDLAFRRDGELFAYSLGPAGGQLNAGNVGTYLNIDSTGGAANGNGDDGLTFQRNTQNGQNTENDPNAFFFVDAVAFRSSAASKIISPTAVNRQAVSNNNTSSQIVVGRRANFVDAQFDSRNQGRFGEIPRGLTQNILYSAQPASGTLTSRFSDNANANRDYGATAPYGTFYGPAGSETEIGVVNTGQFTDGARGLGGVITGMVEQTNFGDFLAVTDLGEVHTFDIGTRVTAPAGSGADGYDSLIPTQYFGTVPVNPAHNVPTLVFTSVDAGPQFIDGGRLAQTYFATTTDGWLYAFELDGSRVVPATVFYGGRTAVPLVYENGVNVTADTNAIVGLAFSPLEVNPFHLTDDRDEDLGHGIRAPYDQSRINTTGGGSLYFGFEIDGDADNNTLARPDNDNLGQISPGGVHGSVISHPFDLRAYSTADKPTLYFSYFAEVENNDDFSRTQVQNDSFRVFGRADDGQWQLLATNNSFRELINEDEYDTFNESGIVVQEIFDDANVWRQVRVDISPFAGSENVQLRFDVSTAGSQKTRFDSINVSAVAGRELIDREVARFSDEAGVPVLFETILGRDLVLPSVAALEVGDQFTVALSPTSSLLRPTDSPVLTYTLVPTASTFNAETGAVNVQLLPSDTIDTLARRIVEISPRAALVSYTGAGRINFGAANTIDVDAQLNGGQANPVEIVRPGVDVLTLPTGDNAVEGEQIIIDGTALTFSSTPPAMGTAFTPGEIFFAPGDSSRDLALRVLQQAPTSAGAYLNVDGDLVFANGQAFVAPAASQITINNEVSGEQRFTITLPRGNQLNDNQVIDFVANDGTVRSIRFVDSNAPDNVADNIIPFQDNTTGATLAARLEATLGPEFSDFVNGATVSVSAASVTEVARRDIVCHLRVGVPTGHAAAFERIDRRRNVDDHRRRPADNDRVRRVARHVGSRCCVL